MAEASRFPHLAPPFAIVGAAGGWLSASLVSSPLVQRFQADLRVPAALVAAIFSALAGALITRLCTQGGLHYDLDKAEWEARPPADRWIVHALVMLATGTVTGSLVAALGDVYNGASFGALAGLGCAAAFVPVCLLVVATARRAQRARLGSLVSASDRRAVWGILATTLSVATLEALPSWPAAGGGEGPTPIPAVVMLVAAALVISAILVADARDLRRAKEALAPGLVTRDPGKLAPTDVEAPKLDLGLGEEVGARVAPPADVYRGRARTVALVQGDAEQTTSAFRRAFLRGRVGLGLVLITACAHMAAASDLGQRLFDERRCDSFEYRSCARLADAARETDPARAMSLYEKACGVTSTSSCITLGEMYLGTDDTGAPRTGPRSEQDGDRKTFRRAIDFFARACRYGDTNGCTYVNGLAPAERGSRR